MLPQRLPVRVDQARRIGQSVRRLLHVSGADGDLRRTGVLPEVFEELVVVGKTGSPGGGVALRRAEYVRRPDALGQYNQLGRLIRRTPYDGLDQRQCLAPVLERCARRLCDRDTHARSALLPRLVRLGDRSSRPLHRRHLHAASRL